MNPWLMSSLGASAIWIAVLWFSDRGIQRIWPPARGSWPVAIAAWVLTTAIYVGMIRGAGWNAFDWPAWFRWGVGGAGLTALSFWVQGRGIWDLGLAGTSGWAVGVETGGAYARRRHPQYLGQIVSMVGLALLIASWGAVAAAMGGTLALLYASWVEDRSLTQRYPEDFAAYRGRVRFY